MLYADIFMSCVWLILLCFRAFTLISYEPYVVISCCTHFTCLDVGYEASLI